MYFHILKTTLLRFIWNDLHMFIARSRTPFFRIDNFQKRKETDRQTVADLNLKYFE